MGDNNINGHLSFPRGFATKAIHAGQRLEQGTSGSKKCECARSGTSTREVLESILAELDGAEFGLVFASGVGALTTLFTILNEGDHVICNDEIYGGTSCILNTILTKIGIKTSFIDARYPHLVEEGITPTTKLILVETLTNPCLKVVDIAAIAKIAKAHDILLAVDNTFLTPFLHRPLDFGADIVIHSLTKYINGHSDVLMGAILTSNEEIYKKVKFLQKSLGIVPSAFDCSQVTRGLQTLALRMKQHSYNALKIAQFLEKHPKVEKVLHTGLPSHTEREVFKKQAADHSGMVTFYVMNGTIDQTIKFLSNLKVFAFGSSLGGVESLVSVPLLLSHRSLSPSQQKKLHITENMIRLSVGIEDVEDLIQDLEDSFNLI